MRAKKGATSRPGPRALPLQDYRALSCLLAAAEELARDTSPSQRPSLGLGGGREAAGAARQSQRLERRGGEVRNPQPEMVDS